MEKNLNSWKSKTYAHISRGSHSGPGVGMPTVLDVKGPDDGGPDQIVSRLILPVPARLIYEFLETIYYINVTTLRSRLKRPTSCRSSLERMQNY